MKKNISIKRQYALVPDFSLMSLKVLLVQVLQLKRRMRPITVFYSRLAGQLLSTGDVLRIIHVQLVTMVLLLVLSVHPLLTLVGVSWLCLALWQCRGI